MSIPNEKLSKAVDGLKKRLCCVRPVAHYCRDICLEDPSLCDVAVAIEAMETLQKTQTADVVEIVRCKDCKEFDDIELAAGKKKCFCYIHGENFPPDYFCASAERRNN